MIFLFLLLFKNVSETKKTYLKALSTLVKNKNIALLF